MNARSGETVCCEPVQPRVLGLVHDTHTATVQLFDDAVVWDALPGQSVLRKNLNLVLLIKVSRCALRAKLKFHFNLRAFHNEFCNASSSSGPKLLLVR
jgi:hypothetical protein